jgi:MFS family permease
MPPLYRRYLIIYAVFALGNSADAFLLLRARQLGASPAAVIGLFAWFNAVTVCCAWPAGRISDIIGRRGIVIGGQCVFAAAYSGMGAAHSTAWLWTLFALYGIYSGVAEGAAKAYLVDLAGPERKATALGYHGAVAGGAALCASLLAGVLWERVSPAAPFLVGGAAALLAAILLLFMMPPALWPGLGTAESKA